MSELSDTSVRKTGAGAASPDRRELLKRLLAAALTEPVFWANGRAIAETLPLGRDRFLELSKKLCAMQIEDGVLADVIQKVLLDRFTADELKRIATILESASPRDVDNLISGSGFRELAKSIVSIWYSGQVGAGEGARVLAYEDALAWPATGYGKAPGTCSLFGDWTAKPAKVIDPGHRQ